MPPDLLEMANISIRADKTCLEALPSTPPQPSKCGTYNARVFISGEFILNTLPLKNNILLDNSQKHRQPCLINQTPACAFLSAFGTSTDRVPHDPHLFLFASL